MIILSIGSDRNLFIKDSDAQNRIREYGKLFNQLHIIVFSGIENNYQNIIIDDNIFVYPTNHTLKLFYLHKIYKIAKSIYKNNKFSAITAQDPFESGLAGWLLKLIYKAPLQIQIHTDVFSPYFWRESLNNKIRVFLAEFLLLKADGIRVVSERIRLSLELNVKCSRFHRGFSTKSEQMPNVSVLPIFVDVNKIRNAKIEIDLHKKYPQYDFIILMASRLTREKNIGMAIKAFSEMAGRKSEIKNPLLLIVGEGPELDNLKVQSRKLKIDGNVIFQPWTDNLVSCYKTADLFLLTSNYEGYGRTVVEAMAAGLPVIMTNVGLAGDILKDNLNGLVIPVNDLGELKRGIRILMDSREKRNSISRKSIETTADFMAKKDYLEKYRNLMLI